MVFMMFASVNALSFETDQTSNINDYQSADKGNIIIDNVAGNINLVLSTINATINRTYDKSWEFPSMTEDFYIIVNNYVPNTSGVIMFRGDLTKNPTLFVQNITFNQQGRYFFKFSPDYANEVGEVYLDIIPTGGASFVTAEYIEEKPKGFNSIISVFATGLSEIITININLWKVLYYTVIFILSLGGALIIFGLAFLMFKYTEKLKRKNNKGD